MPEDSGSGWARQFEYQTFQSGLAGDLLGSENADLIAQCMDSLEPEAATCASGGSHG